MQRRWANISLGITALLLLIALLLPGRPWSPYVLSMALAGLAGGIADWYAVTALFRHPLGQKWLPHTSIISANRDRIIDALARLVERELLSAEFLESRLSQINWDGVFGLVMDYEPSAETLEFVRDAGMGLRSLLPADEVALAVQRLVARQAADVMVSDWAVRVLKWLIQSDHDRALFDFLARHAVEGLNSVEFTDDMETRLKVLLDQYTRTATQKFVLGLLESMGTVDYRVLSREVKDHLIRWLESDKAFDQFELILVRMMVSLRDDPAVRERVERIKTEAVAYFPWERLVNAGGQEVDAWLASPERVSGQWRALRRIATEALQEHPSYREALADWAKRALVGSIRRFHPVIGRLVRQNLEQMNEREWIDKLEWYVGQDLQWIRINGAIVGGLVGLLIAILMHV
ncbi:MAG: DUF445 domain-containing protein [Thermaerobacter sp.]|nr:DUF445 domain-containing protein [Thermaerobacter sp.]